MYQQAKLLDVFNLAGIPCRLECDDDVFGSFLASRYAEFASRADPQLSLRVEIVDALPDDVLEPSDTLFARIGGGAGVLTVTGADFRGVFDERAGDGWIVQPPDPAPFETLLTAICARYLLRNGGFLLHAAALQAPEGARVFFGPSGSGKTTLAERIGEGVITDEISVIRRVGHEYRVSGVPWRGSKLDADLAGLFALRKARATAFERLAPAAAVRRLLPSVFFARADALEIAQFLAAAAPLAAAVDCYDLQFTPDCAFWGALPGRARGGGHGLAL